MGRPHISVTVATIHQTPLCSNDTITADVQGAENPFDGEWLPRLQAMRAMVWLNEDFKARQDEQKAKELRRHINNLKSQISRVSG